MKPINEMSQVEFAAYIQSHLFSKGIEVVLSGGAAAAFYSDNKYVSLDIDLVNLYFIPHKKLEETMMGFGFSSQGRYFTHPETEFWVEFPPGPPAVGKEPIKEIDLVTLATGTLRIFSPTDSVKDRLLAYVYWDDQQTLDQAKWIV